VKASTLAAAVVRFRWLLIALFVAVTGFFATQLSRAELDTEMKNQLPADLPTRVNLKRIEELFGGTDLAMIVLATDDVLRPATLERVKALSGRMQRLSEFDRVVSLFTAKDLRGEDGEMIVEPAVPRVPQSEQERKALRTRLKDNPLVYGNLISKDFRYAVLIGFLDPKASDESLVQNLEGLVAEIPGKEETFVGGMPVTRVALTQDMRRDMKKFLPAGLLIMLVFLLACFRQARGVVLPFVMTVMAIVVAMGLIPMLGWKIHTVTILLPVILLAVANDYGIHIMARYQEDNAPGTDFSSAELARRGVIELTFPVLATGLTTVVGMLCLLSHMIIPAKQLGVLAACGVAFAMVGSLTFIPAVLSVLPKAKPVFDARATRSASRSLLDRMLLFFARSVPRHPRRILWASVLVSLGVGAGTAFVVVDTNPMSFYRQTEPVWRSTHLLNEHLGGWAGVSVVVEGDIKDPKVLREIDAIEQHLGRHELVGTTTSLAGVLRKMNQVMHDGDPAFDRVPDTRELVAQYLLLYSMSGDAEDFEKLVDFPYRNAQVMAKVTDSGTRAATEVLGYTRAYLGERPGRAKTLVGGFLDVMADMVHHIVWGQVVSMALAALLVGLQVGGLLRSVVAGVLAVFPLLLALIMIFGVMGFFGIELNLVTALLSSIMIGVGVDYSIHFLWRYRDERRAGLDPAQAVERTLTTTGRGIVFNGLSVVVGFAVLVVSAFYPVRFFGLLVAISILASLVGALVVLPAVVVVFRPKFLEPGEAFDGGVRRTVGSAAELGESA
jgi:hypothetical protein